MWAPLLTTDRDWWRQSRSLRRRCQRHLGTRHCRPADTSHDGAVRQVLMDQAFPPWHATCLSATRGHCAPRGGLMRALFVSLLIPLLAACSTMSPVSASPSLSDVDVSGRWTGTWVGTGLFNSPREDSITLDLRQLGYAGYGRMVFEGTTAAESIPWEVRREGLAGIRVGATISGSQVHVKHELGGRIFTADFTLLSDDRMVGEVRGSPGVRMLLTRAARREAPQARALPE